LFTSIISSLVNQNQGYPSARDSSSTLHNQWHTGRPCRLVGQHRAGELVASPMGSGGWLAAREHSWRSHHAAFGPEPRWRLWTSQSPRL